MASNKKILIVVTSHEKLGNTGTKTGFWLEELAAPYYEFVDAGAEVDIASPLGGRPPADPKSEESPKGAVKRFLDDATAQKKLADTKRLDAIETGAYDAIFVAGGHGVMWDLVTDTALAKLLGRQADDGRVVAAVCHGPAALVSAKKKNGEPIVKGKRVASFTNAEEKAAGLTDIVPFLLESRLAELGATHEHGAMWSSFAVRDGFLVTGQNPQSSVLTAKETLAAIESSRAH
jgi:putative intracellular protease/amidase